MKIYDVIGFAFILSAGYLVGKQQANVSWNRTNMIEFIVFLIAGFYFAVVLS